MPIPFPFNFKKPNYREVVEWRLDRLSSIRKSIAKDPNTLPLLKSYYRENIAQFIIDWGMTFDPRNVSKKLPSTIPFLLFPRQEEWMNWFMERWKTQTPGINDKAREMGVSWLSLAASASICLLYDGVSVGFGSRKEEYIDKSGSPKSLFYKLRMFIKLLPPEFRGIWDEKKHSRHLRILFPETESVIAGEAGANIGRGDRASFFILDEAAWIEQPDLVEAALSQTTDCRIDISTPHGMNNPFARKRHGGNISVFTFKWTDDPRKDAAWYDKKCKDIDNPTIVAQEIDLDYMASVEGVVIPAEWVRSALDAHVKLNITPSGIRRLGFDVADEGKDKNGVLGRHGIVVNYIDFWSGKDADIFESVKSVFLKCDAENFRIVKFDSDGLGAGVRGDARVINKDRAKNNKVEFIPFRGSGEVINPEGDPFNYGYALKAEGTGVTNADFFANAKSQGWWYLRKRFQLTHRAIKEGILVNPDEIISLSSSTQNIEKLMSELSQPTYSQNQAGKILIDKSPDGSPSPNLADALMICFSPDKVRARGLFG